MSQLGLKPQSLEGCNKTLGSTINELQVIYIRAVKLHDILGLSFLSKLVPIIKEKLKDLRLVKDVEGIDPKKKMGRKACRAE